MLATANQGSPKGGTTLVRAPGNVPIPECPKRIEGARFGENGDDRFACESLMRRETIIVHNDSVDMSRHERCAIIYG
ncbi:hypothetical protein SAMN05444167_1093 [Terriglobus roseus]|uniref:Uncharacterized protein n=1 Tax=Terriglobus roseus TaxID=392734 RepID=A0A1G7HJB2_9BACT|nr:hypothetical protein SAMN05444167_1093 [Terriglobus roseus]